MFIKFISFVVVLHSVMAAETVPANKAVDDEDSRPCPNYLNLNSVRAGKKCYYLQRAKNANWYQANKICSARGLQLASIESQKEFDTIKEFLNKLKLQKHFFWTSGTDLGSENKYYWMNNGREFSYKNWAPDQPEHRTHDSGEVEHCVLLYFGDDWPWHDHVCSFDTALYICQL